MRELRSEGRYRWTAFVLSQPCEIADTSWSNTRAGLRAAGWGLAVLYHGQRALPEKGCAGGLPTPAQAGRDALAADTLARQQGFPAGTTLFLAAGTVGTLSPAYSAYLEAWADSLLALGRFRPGLQSSAPTAIDAYHILDAAYDSAKAPHRRPLWVIAGPGFALGRRPGRSGVAQATIWQNALAIPWPGTSRHRSIYEAVSKLDHPSVP